MGLSRENLESRSERLVRVPENAGTRRNKRLGSARSDLFEEVEQHVVEFRRVVEAGEMSCVFDHHRGSP